MVYALYVLIFLITLVLFYFGFEQKKLFIVVNISILIIIMGFRPLHIMDTHTYCRIFNETKTCSFSELLYEYKFKSNMELGFRYLMKLSSLISPHYTFFQFLIAIFYCVSTMIFVYNNSSNIVVGMTIFLGIGLYFQAFNIMREYLAISICLLSWILFKKNNLVGSLILVLIAILIHKSALVFLVVFPIEYCKKIGIWKSCVPILLIVVVIFSTNIVEFLVDFLGIYQEYGQQSGYRVGFIVIVWAIVAIFSLFILYNPSFSEDDKINAIFCLIYLCFCLIGIKFQLVERVGLYFMPFTIPLFSTIGNYLRKLNDDIFRVFNIGVTICFLTLFILTGNSEQYSNYYFCFI